MRLLIVEDNRVNQKVVSIMLERMGIAADLADSGEAAMELVREQRYDLILMDLHMPGMNGCECASSINHELGEEAPPIVALTADAFSIQEMKPKYGSWAGILNKPVNAEELQACLEETVPGYHGG